MECSLRIKYAGASYHVMNRGDRRENIFLNAEDREHFLKTSGSDTTSPRRKLEVFGQCPFQKYVILNDRPFYYPFTVAQTSRLGSLDAGLGVAREGVV